MEIRFCSICNESIPDGEFDAGRAIVSAKKSQHVACALRQSVEKSGARSWLTFFLALFAAAASVYLLAARAGEPDEPPAITEVPQVVEDRIVAQVQDGEDRVLKKVDGLKQSLEGDLGTKIDNLLRIWSEKTLRPALDKQGTIQREVNSRIHDRLTSFDARLVKVQQNMAEFFDWKARIQIEADQLRRDLEAAKNRAVPAPPAPPATPPDMSPSPQPNVTADAEREKEIDRWIKRLGDADEDIVFSATIELARLKALRAAPALVRVLRRHKDFYARLGAATALGEIQAADAVPDLIEALNDKDDLVRTAASEALHRVTQQDFNFVSGLTKSERVRIQKKWRTWWRDNETKVRDRLGQKKTG